jgi:SAM-dependent methyltransferase
LYYGRAIAVDLSHTSILQAVRLGYVSGIVADARHLPFRENVFDLVISSHFLGHIPLESKDEVIGEIFRVTKPGGFSLHSIECDSNSWFYRRAKQSPELYQKYFVQMYGHFGLELPAANFERFRKAGFIPCIEEADSHKGYIRPINSYAVFFDNEYKNQSLVLRTLAVISRLCIRLPRAFHAGINVILGILVPLAALFTPADHRDSLKCLYKKPPMSQINQSS